MAVSGATPLTKMFRGKIIPMVMEEDRLQCADAGATSSLILKRVNPSIGVRLTVSSSLWIQMMKNLNPKLLR